RPFFQLGHRPRPITTTASAIARNASGVATSAKPATLYARYVRGWPSRGFECVYSNFQYEKNRSTVIGLPWVSEATFHASNENGSWCITQPMWSAVATTYATN